MTENDNQTTETIIFDGFDTDTEGDEDIHLCKKCKLVFTNLSDYLQHKVKHDNYKVKLSRTSDRRMVVPQLIQKPEKTKPEKGSEKENIQQKKRAKKKFNEPVNPELVITERQSYWCPKCDIKFNREATLRRHVEYVHDQSGEYTTSMGDGSDGEEKREAEEENKPDVQEDSDPTDADFNIKEELRVTLKSSTKEVQVEHIPLQTADKGDRPYACSICGNRFKEAPVLRAHLLTHSSTRDFPCTIEGCNYAFKTKGSLKRHMRRHTGERPFKCDECGRTFTESGALTRHLKSRIPCKQKSDLDLPRYGKRWSANAMYGPQAKVETRVVPEKEDQEQEDAVKDMETECAVAEVIASNENGEVGVTVEEISMDGVTISTDNILEEEIINPTQCKVCKEDFLSCDILKIHLRAHLADIPFRCGMCHFVAESRSQLSDHMTSLHQNQLKGSELISQIPEGTSETNQDQSRIARIAVNQLLELPSSLEVDEPEPSIHRARNIYKCPVCARAVKSQNYLRLHMKSHMGDRPHKCSHCQKSFITKDTLSKHLSVHNESRNFKCGQCGKLFKRISHVREHLKIHSIDRPFMCTVCHKAFKTNNAMKVHLRTHTTILPYVCPYCRRRFREKGSLLRHQRMHTGERPFKCPHCHRAFAEHGTLNRHLKAKVPCNRQLQEARDKEKKEFTVLAEFSSVVADTQQYIVDEDSTQEQSQEDEATEYVVVQTGLSAEDLQNVEIITEGEVDQNFLEGVQVTDDYVVITDSGDNMKILNSKTGETLAMMPISTIDDGGQIVTLPVSDNHIEAVAMAPSSVGEIETVTIDHSDINKIEAVAMNPAAMPDNQDVEELETITLLTSSGEDMRGDGYVGGEMGTESVDPAHAEVTSINEIEAVAMAPDADIGDTLHQAMMAASVADDHVHV
ncbi:transcription factor E4F1-like [Saccostrea echinata]|uniref:transcription factor E4F1-like n=1 Tax=Saccostrea echinata TaxID=191078 RepID=UPI002A7F3714|nr:transcription factor E4F1-like [Saccostrea echinata]